MEEEELIEVEDEEECIIPYKGVAICFNFHRENEFTIFDEDINDSWWFRDLDEAMKCVDDRLERKKLISGLK